MSPINIVQYRVYCQKRTQEKACYQFEEAAFKSFLECFQSGSLEHVPAFRSLCLELRLSAIRADEAVAAAALTSADGGRWSRVSAGNDPEQQREYRQKVQVLSRLGCNNLEACEILLKKGFRFAITDKRNPLAKSRKWGAVAAANQLLKIYFRLNKVSGKPQWQCLSRSSVAVSQFLAPSTLDSLSLVLIPLLLSSFIGVLSTPSLSLSTSYDCCDPSRPSSSCCVDD